MRPRVVWPRVTDACGWSSRNAVRPRTSSSRSLATTTARFSNVDRLVASDAASSTRSASTSIRRPATCLSASSARADSSTGTAPTWIDPASPPPGENEVPTPIVPRGADEPGAWRSTSAELSTGVELSTDSGAASSTTCAFVPERPKEETPARRGWPVAGHGSSVARSLMEPEDQSTLVEGWSTWRVRGRTPARRASTILMMEATPEAIWVWPMFDFMEPSRSGVERFWP